MNTTATTPATPNVAPDSWLSRPLHERQVEIVTNAKDYGLSLTIADTDDGPLYTLRGVNRELVIRTYDLYAADVAVVEYEPPLRSAGHVQDRRQCVKVQLAPPFAGDPHRVIISTAPSVRGEFTQVAELGMFEAGALAHDLIRALSMVADPRAFSV
ncbi:hypothetical protein [Tsukamurella tyrosinosolvens]|uniref:hypothetical protein n=1 Tax=Tsukamurella tyrosinosolvens TaxID=57704 RepID=UPI000C7F729E|nr:hypothetical protein [Tsukamurella tyrosinosolvens]AUN39984.1 hypothetical protein ASU32_08135 [Tsukamurella tyrosinosolvens]